MIDLKLKWIKQGEFIYEATNGILFTVKTLIDLFADYPKLEVRAIRNLTAYPANNGKIENEINLLISGDFIPDPALLPSPAGANPVRQHVKGDAESGTLRYVYQFIGPRTGLPFRAGLTVHAAQGTWSSLPHEFESKAILSPRPLGFFEQFAYVTCPRGGWGVQVRIGHLNGTMVNEVVTCGDRDILNIPLGSHPVNGGPGVKLAYFWIYTADVLSLVEKFED